MDQLNGVPLLVVCVKCFGRIWASYSPSLQLGNKNDLEGAVGVNELIKAL